MTKIDPLSLWDTNQLLLTTSITLVAFTSPQALFQDNVNYQVTKIRRRSLTVPVTALSATSARDV
ncbi:hypothetical protein HNR39_000669 [Glaciimonas immobilis]|uniref:Uncharacterized protein n=1 Tax=Glaciimonas immobilis TaxID=728004 RepID=A0A840RQU5_9BURK|nr:hypothetical protein [Glaciimonas immobilis]